MKRIFLMGALAAGLSVSASANTFTFQTPTGSTTGGGPVDALATFVTGPGSLTITLKNLQANPTDVAQLISDLSFGVPDAIGSSETGASSQELTVNGNGTFSVGANLTTVAADGWVLTTTATTMHLDVLQGPGHAGPAHLIIGPPGGPTYVNANGSIAGNGPHNPFLNQVATITITDPNMTAADTIDNVVFSFGTTEGAALVSGVTVPEGGMTVVLLGMALSGLGLIRRKLR